MIHCYRIQSESPRREGPPTDGVKQMAGVRHGGDCNAMMLLEGKREQTKLLATGDHTVPDR